MVVSFRARADASVTSRALPLRGRWSVGRRSWSALYL